MWSGPGCARSTRRGGKPCRSPSRRTGRTKTVARADAGFSDIRTCIHVHDAIEREFGIDINDRATLINDFETAYYIVLQSHDAN